MYQYLTIFRINNINNKYFTDYTVTNLIKLNLITNNNSKLYNKKKLYKMLLNKYYLIKDYENYKNKEIELKLKYSRALYNYYRRQLKLEIENIQNKKKYIIKKLEYFEMIEKILINVFKP